jgi:hypothetical protein
MIGGFHIDMTIFKSIGSAMEESGWTGALVESSTTTPDFAMDVTDVPSKLSKYSPLITEYRTRSVHIRNICDYDG